VAVNKPEKATRNYSSEVRREQAERTRTRIVEAAGASFETKGYARTTVRSIADQAGVAPDTVYPVVGTKARVLTAVIDARLAPAGEPNVLDRPEAHAIRDEPDQRRQIELLALDLAGVLERVRGVYEILRTAASVEPDMAQIHTEMDRYRLANMQRAISWIAANGPLRVDEASAAESLWVLASPDVSRMLLDGRGWTIDRYVAWLTATITRVLLPST
jgi:AcrR family transcriptional regulator